PVQNQFKIYPNPAKNRIQLVFDSSIKKGFHLRIIDAQGKVVQEQTQLNTTKLKIDIHHLVAGLYSIVILTKDGQVLEQKLIVR
ncbi:MAG: T9SS type A sorting domain-containing protein, partial [Aureispira sp.]|nr:T9SS type A sorting domain-containing protein [Aureispira sp.]